MLSRPIVALWGLLCSIYCAWPVALAADDDGQSSTTVVVSRNGPVFKIESFSTVYAGHDIAWAVLTDYGGYVNFVPGMTVSRRVSDKPLRIEQRGEFGILFFRKQVHATLEVVESPPSSIYFRSLEGNLRTLETMVAIHSDGGKVVITYRSVIEPDFWVPPVIGTPIVRAAIRRKLGAVAEEIERRAQLTTNQ